MKDRDQQLIWEAYGFSEDDDKAASRAGLAPFSSSHEQEGWPAMDTIEFHGDVVIDLAIDWLDDELLSADSYMSIDDDMRADLPSMVIDGLQKKKILMNHLDYNEHEDERREHEDAIHEYLDKNFSVMKARATKKLPRGGFRNAPTPPVDPASPRDREVARRASLGSHYRPDEEDLNFGARDRD